MLNRRPLVLEVERKFRALGVPILTQHAGVPAFQSLWALPSVELRDTYYDRGGVLAAAGAWVRRRNGAWQAKIRQGGDFVNSRFEEVQGAAAIAARLTRITQLAPLTQQAAPTAGEQTAADRPADRDLLKLGLLPVAAFTTQRAAWQADGAFRIVLDTMDFGHEVGEVELQCEWDGDGDGDGDASGQGHRRKAQLMQEMDERIAAFMQRYAWAFAPGEPRGKLTAYFDKIQGQGSGQRS